MQGTASCTQARKAMHGLDGQHMDRTPRGRVGENNRTEINGESSSWYWPTLVSRTAKEQNSHKYEVQRCGLLLKM